MKFLIITLVLSLFSKDVSAQASSATDFVINIQKNGSSRIYDYDFFVLNYDGATSIQKCHYKIDSVTNSIKIYGHISYIVCADNLTFVISKKEQNEFGKSFRYIISATGLERNFSKIKNQTIRLNDSKPFIEIGTNIANNYVFGLKYYSKEKAPASYSSPINIETDKWNIITEE